jgi:hypothetical protein
VLEGNREMESLNLFDIDSQNLKKESSQIFLELFEVYYFSFPRSSVGMHTRLTIAYKPPIISVTPNNLSVGTRKHIDPKV